MTQSNSNPPKSNPPQSNPPQEDEALELKIDEVLLGVENWVDSQHVHSNNGSYRLTPDEAKASLLTIMRQARIQELQKVYEFPKGRFKTDIYNMMEFAHNRIEQLRKEKA